MVAEKVFAVIAESTRRDILEALAQESKAVGQLVDELGVSQPTVSKHLRVLREAGVVTMRAQGQKRFYGINTEPLGLVADWLDSLGASLSAGMVPAGTDTSAALAGAATKTVPAKESPKEQMPTSPATPVEKVPVAAAAAATNTPSMRPAAEESARVLPVTPAAAQTKTAQTKTVAAVSVPAAASPRELTPFVQSNENDGSVQGQISRSVGRAANKAADVLANLPALPRFRRRKD